MKSFSSERKEAVLKKLLPPLNMTVAEVSKHEGISTASLYNWRKQARLEGAPVPGPNKITDDWSVEAKFAVVLETATLSESGIKPVLPGKRLIP